MAQRAVNGPVLRWHVCADADSVAEAALEYIARAAADTIARRGTFSIVLSGGGTPRPIYERARYLSTSWNRWQVYFADERCVPAGHRDRNDVMARRVWLDHVPIPRQHVHAIPAEEGAEAAAAAYTREVAGQACFDLVLLGMGEDGHTASLFPGQPSGPEPDAPAALAVHDAPKPPAERVSLSAARLSAAFRMLLIVTGEGKRDAVRRLHAGEDIPVRSLRPQCGIDVWLDRAAGFTVPVAGREGV